MEIGLYHDSAGTRHAGGVAIYAQWMAAELSKRNEVSLYTQSGEFTELVRSSDIDIIEVPSFSNRIPDALGSYTPISDQNWAKLAMAIWSARSDVIQQMNDDLDVLCTFQWLDDVLLSNAIDVPTVFQYHGLANTGVGVKLRETLSDTEFVLANSHDTATAVRETLGYDVEDVIYPGVDTGAFLPSASPAFTSDDPVILFVGRATERKGAFDLIEAFATLDGDARLCIIGRGNEEVIRGQCERHGVWDSTTILGEIPHHELPNYYAAADVFCLPSYSEGFGMVNLEAMACGTPVVTSDLEAIRAYITNKENGLLVEPGDTVAISNAISRLLDSTELRAALGERGRETALEFSWEQQASRLEEFCINNIGTAAESTTDNERFVRPQAQLSGTHD